MSGRLAFEWCRLAHFQYWILLVLFIRRDSALSTFMNVGKSHDFRPNQTLGILKKKTKTTTKLGSNHARLVCSQIVIILIAIRNDITIHRAGPSIDRVTKGKLWGAWYRFTYEFYNTRHVYLNSISQVTNCNTRESCLSVKFTCPILILVWITRGLWTLCHPPLNHHIISKKNVVNIHCVNSIRMLETKQLLFFLLNH